MNATYEILVNAEQLDLINKALRHLMENPTVYGGLEFNEKEEIEILVDLTDTQSDLLKTEGLNSFIN
jgi:hypothetical protein